MGEKKETHVLSMNRKDEGNESEIKMEDESGMLQLIAAGCERSPQQFIQTSNKHQNNNSRQSY